MRRESTLGIGWLHCCSLWVRLCVNLKESHRWELLFGVRSCSESDSSWLLCCSTGDSPEETEASPPDPSDRSNMYQQLSVMSRLRHLTSLCSRSSYEYIWLQQCHPGNLLDWFAKAEHNYSSVKPDILYQFKPFYIPGIKSPFQTLLYCPL